MCSSVTAAPRMARSSMPSVGSLGTTRYDVLGDKSAASVAQHIDCTLDRSYEVSSFHHRGTKSLLLPEPEFAGTSWNEGLVSFGTGAWLAFLRRAWSRQLNADILNSVSRLSTWLLSEPHSRKSES